MGFNPFFWHLTPLARNIANTMVRVQFSHGFSTFMKNAGLFELRIYTSRPYAVVMNGKFLFWTKWFCSKFLFCTNFAVLFWFISFVNKKNSFTCVNLLLYAYVCSYMCIQDLSSSPTEPSGSANFPWSHRSISGPLVFSFLRVFYPGTAPKFPLGILLSGFGVS